MDDENRLVPSEVENALREEDEHLNFLRRNMPIRHILTIMGFLSFTLLNMLRVNMSVGIICMVDWNYLPDKSGDQSCRHQYSENVTTRSHKEDGPLVIPTDMQGHILAGYFYGLLASQYIGVLVAEKLSAKYIFLFGTFVSSICSAVVPLVADHDGIYIIILQILKGAGQGFIIPAFNILVGKWIPKSEIFYSMCLIGSGIPFGGFLGTYLSGVICASLTWPYVFYIFGGIGLAWCVVWLIMIFESPLTHPYITHHEMLRILKSLVVIPHQTPVVVPYKYIGRSLPVWAYVIVGFVSFWSLTIFTTLVPTFMSTVLKFEIEMAAVYASLPYTLEMITFLYACVLNARLKKIGRVSDTKIHKFQIVVGLLGFSACILGVAFTGCDRILTVVFLSMALGFCGIIFASTSYIPLQLSPRFSGVISAIMNTVGAITGIIVPTMMGYLTREKRTMNEWQILFFLTAGLGVYALIFFLIFGSSSTQDWDDPAYRGIQESQGRDPQELLVEVDTLPEEKY